MKDTTAVETRYRIVNHTHEPWRAADGFAVGYHIFDPETGILLVDGPRVALERDLAPGEAYEVTLPVELPKEEGEYRVFVSGMQENVAWFYQRNWPFLLIDATVRGGQAEVAAMRITTWSALRWRALPRTLGRAIVYPFRTYLNNRAIIGTMVRRDFMGRYRGSFIGAFWTVLNPLLLMITYFFVFGVVLKARFGNDPSRSGFGLYFFAGMLPWLAFSEAVGRAPSVMIEHRNFVKKLVFAIETLPLNLVAAGLVTELIGIAIFLIFHLIARGNVLASIVWLPLLLIPQIWLTAGLCWFLAALGVFLRDLGQVIGFVLTLWFFLTPICYPEASLPREVAPLMSLNPFYALVRAYRAILLEGHAPALASLSKFWAVSFAVFVAGHAWFYKLRKTFADIL